MHRGHPRLVEQIGDQLFVRRDHRALRRRPADQAGHVGIDVERPLRRRAADPRNRVQQPHHQIAPPLERGVALGQEILRTVQRRHRRRLRDRTGVGRGLRLQLGHRLDEPQRPAGIADPPAGHRIGLGTAVHRHRPVVQVRAHLRDRREPESVIDDMLVHVVGQDHHMRVPAEHRAQRLQLGRAIGRARRVRRRIEDHPLRPVGDRGLDLRGRHLVMLVRARLHDHRRAARELHDIGVAHPIGCRDHHLVARIQRGDQRVEQRMLAAHVHADLRGGIGQVVVTQELGGDCGLQLGGAVDIGIFGLARADRGDRGLLHEIGRVEIGLARAQADHVDPLRLQVQHPARHGERRRRRDAVQAGGSLGHDRGPLSGLAR